MKKRIALFTFLFCFQFTRSIGQVRMIDSLKHVMENQIQDTNHVLILYQLSVAYMRSHPDSTMLLAEQGLDLARKLQYRKGEAYCTIARGQSLNQTGNYPRALENFLDALKQSEQINDGYGISISATNIAFVYANLYDYKQATPYYKRAIQVAENMQNPKLMTSAYINIGDNYEKLGQLDSAKFYDNKGYDLAEKMNYISSMAIASDNLGDIYSKMGETALALDYYRSSLAEIKKIGNDDALSETFLGMAKMFQKTGHADSVIFYARQAFLLGKVTGITRRVYDAATFLYEYYKVNRNIDSAFFYQSETIVAKDSLYNQEKAKQLQTLNFNEAMRQQQIASEKERVEEERNNNIQFGILAITIICFTIVFLLLARSLIVNENWVRFLGILGLLLVFEFVNLFIHPYIEEFTHHSPALTLLVLVAIASLLIPLHHRIEHWVRHKLVEKNKKIRLAMAKKIVAKLEPQPGSDPGEKRLL